MHLQPEHLYVQIEIIYLVVHLVVASMCMRKYRKRYTQVYNIIIVVPASPNLDVIEGAVLWRKNTQKIKVKCTDATYGTAVTIPFDETQHIKHHFFYLKEAM